MCFQTSLGGQRTVQSSAYLTFDKSASFDDFRLDRRSMLPVEYDCIRGICFSILRLCNIGSDDVSEAYTMVQVHVRLFVASQLSSHSLMFVWKREERRKQTAGRSVVIHLCVTFVFVSQIRSTCRRECRRRARRPALARKARVNRSK